LGGYFRSLTKDEGDFYQRRKREVNKNATMSRRVSVKNQGRARSNYEVGGRKVRGGKKEGIKEADRSYPQGSGAAQQGHGDASGSRQGGKPGYFQISFKGALQGAKSK